MVIDRPTKDELILAVREFLQDKVLPELSGHTNFTLRVAINALKIIERELELGEQLSSEAKARISDLLSAGAQSNSNTLNQDLADAIKSRELTYQDKDLVQHLWGTSLQKLAIDNPKYSSYLKHK